MFRTSAIQRESWRAHYQRIRTPRHVRLVQHIKSIERKRGRQMAAAAASTGNVNNTSNNKDNLMGVSSFSSHVTAPSGAPPLQNVKQNAPGTVPHKYNRFFVNDQWNFVAQHQFVEDPEVEMKRKTTLPEPTNENLWKTPRNPHFEPFAPFLKIVDYGKDPDFKYMKPTNVPRWKDFMLRFKPMVPRTWY